MDITDDTIIGALENRGLRIFIDRNHHIRAADSGKVLNRAGNTEGEINFWADIFTRLADLMNGRFPTGINGRTRSRDRAI